MSFFENHLVILLIIFQHCIMLSRVVLLEDPSLDLRQVISYSYQDFLWFS